MASRTRRIADEIKVNSWSELQERLFDHSWNENLRRFRSSFAFRGIGDKTWNLRTSLMRLGGNFAYLESHLLRNFEKYAPSAVVERDSPWHWIIVGQHHGLPTRLLDWTYSPLVAMHFATADAQLMNTDGAIWMVDYVGVREHLPKRLKAALAKVGGYAFDTDNLSRTVRSLTELDGLTRRPYAVFFEPPAIDDRIVNQFALFSVLSDPALAFDDWLADVGVDHRRVIIPARLKWEIRDKLDQANVTERLLFPGLDGLSAWLRRNYSPGPPAESSAAAPARRRKRSSARTPEDARRGGT